MIQIDWARVQYLMGKIIRGQQVAQDDRNFLFKAWSTDSAKYRATHAEEKANATAEINPLAGKV